MKKNFLLLIIAMYVCKAEAQSSAFQVIDSLLAYGKYRKALKALEAKPISYEVLLKKASIYDKIDDAKNASVNYEKALQIKDDYFVNIAYAKSLKKEKKLIKSIQLFEKVFKKDTLNLFVAYDLSKLYLQTKKAHKAKQQLAYLIKQDSSNYNYHYQLGLVYKLLKKRNLRINSFLKAYKINNTDIRSIEKLAKDFFLLKDLDSASLFINKGLGINRNNVNLNKLKVNKLYLDKKYIELLPTLHHLDSILPNDHFTNKMLGRTYLKLDSLNKAKKYFKSASVIDRTDYKTFTYLGHIALKQEDFEAATVNYFMATMIGNESRDEEYLGLAKVYYKTNKPQKVIKYYKEALRENPSNYIVLLELAKFSDNYYKDKSIAQKYYQQYINKFEFKNKENDSLVHKRLSQIKKILFLEGKPIE